MYQVKINNQPEYKALEAKLIDVQRELTKKAKAFYRCNKPASNEISLFFDDSGNVTEYGMSFFFDLADSGNVAALQNNYSRYLDQKAFLEELEEYFNKLVALFDEPSYAWMGVEVYDAHLNFFIGTMIGRQYHNDFIGMKTRLVHAAVHDKFPNSSVSSNSKLDRHTFRNPARCTIIGSKIVDLQAYYSDVFCYRNSKLRSDLDYDNSDLEYDKIKSVVGKNNWIIRLDPSVAEELVYLEVYPLGGSIAFFFNDHGGCLGYFRLEPSGLNFLFDSFVINDVLRKNHEVDPYDDDSVSAFFVELIAMSLSAIEMYRKGNQLKYVRSNTFCCSVAPTRKKNSPRSGKDVRTIHFIPATRHVNVGSRGHRNSGTVTERTYVTETWKRKAYSRKRKDGGTVDIPEQICHRKVELIVKRKTSSTVGSSSTFDIEKARLVP